VDRAVGDSMPVVLPEIRVRVPVAAAQQDVSVHARLVIEVEGERARASGIGPTVVTTMPWPVPTMRQRAVASESIWLHRLFANVRRTTCPTTSLSRVLRHRLRKVPMIRVVAKFTSRCAVAS
jgi:hypothetical protein